MKTVSISDSIFKLHKLNFTNHTVAQLSMVYFTYQCCSRTSTIPQQARQVYYSSYTKQYLQRWG